MYRKVNVFQRMVKEKYKVYGRRLQALNVRGILNHSMWIFLFEPMKRLNIT